ncbi:MAG TPA: hypothetical protein PKA41_08680 [Verrucomicrobiota bacterium]|nr:hypothetical protein [Verrucomicrobiota bacterium]
MSFSYFNSGSKLRERSRKHRQQLNAAARNARPGRQADIIRCAPGGCEYLTRNEDGKLMECGRPAKYMLNRARGLLYCERCHEFVRRHFDIVEIPPHRLAEFAKLRTQTLP